MNKKDLSSKTKKTLIGIGIAFGTVMVFFLSFFLSFNFIVNPITFTNIGSSDTEKENKELKQEIQSLKDENDVLNTTVEKYRNSKTTVAEPPKADTENNNNNSTTINNAGSESNGNDNSDEGEDNGENLKTEEKPQKEESEKFTPETTVTPETGIVPEVEEPITVIDISE